MPIVRVDLLEGRTVEQKRKLAAAITDVVAEHAEVEAQQVRVVFTDHAPDDWAIAGELVSDRRARAAADAAQAGLDGTVPSRRAGQAELDVAMAEADAARTQLDGAAPQNHGNGAT